MILVVSVVLFLSPTPAQQTSTNSPQLIASPSLSIVQPSKQIFQSDFAQLPQKPKVINDKIFKDAYPMLGWSQLYSRVSKIFVHDRHALAVSYPKGSVGPSQGGAQFLVTLPEQEEYTLTYSVQFKQDFDFRLGGKLPGLTSGGAKWTGGTRPLNGEGWSARLMWRKEGLVELYLYYIDMQGQWGESITFGGYYFEPGKWYEITQRIKVNSPGEQNAVIQIWINDELVLNKQQFRLRVTETGMIDSLFFSTFHGGNQPEWGPLTDSTAFFGDFRVMH